MDQQNAFHSNDYLTLGSHLIFRRETDWIERYMSDSFLLSIHPFLCKKESFLLDQKSRIEGGYEEPLKKGTQIEKAMIKSKW